MLGTCVRHTRTTTTSSHSLISVAGISTLLVVFHEAVEDDVTSGNLSEAHNTSTIIRNTAKLSTEHMSQMLYVGKSARGSVL